MQSDNMQGWKKGGGEEEICIDLNMMYKLKYGKYIKIELM